MPVATSFIAPPDLLSLVAIAAESDQDLAKGTHLRIVPSPLLGLPVNFIFVSDHGMTKVDVDHTLPRPASTPPALLEYQVERSCTTAPLASTKTHLKLATRALNSDSASASKVKV